MSHRTSQIHQYFSAEPSVSVSSKPMNSQCQALRVRFASHLSQLHHLMLFSICCKIFPSWALAGQTSCGLNLPNLAGSCAAQGLLDLPGAGNEPRRVSTLSRLLPLYDEGHLPGLYFVNCYEFSRLRDNYRCDHFDSLLFDFKFKFHFHSSCFTPS